MSSPVPAEDGQLEPAMRKLEDAVADLINEPLKMAGRSDCAQCHNQDCDPECILHTCPGHLTPTDSLYIQLFEAVHEGRTGAAQGTSRPRSIPTGWIDAQRILDEIDFAVKLWQPGFNESTQPTVDRLAAIRDTKYRPQDVHALDQKSDALTSWVQDINTLFDPPAVKHFSEPCPACGEKTAFRKDSAGEVVRVPALQLVANKGCTCQVCHYVWTPEYYTHLARVLGCTLPAGVLE